MSEELAVTEDVPRFVGQSIVRREDRRFLVGAGRYTDDVVVAGLTHGAFLRSHVARGRILTVDISAAEALPGVFAVLRASDLAALAGPHWDALSKATTVSGARVPYQPLAADDVRYVGDPIAFVVASSRAVAEDACDLIEVEIEALPPIVGLDREVPDDGGLVHAEVDTNVAADFTFGEPFAEVARNAPHVFERTFNQLRASPVPMEPRGMVASWVRASEELEVWASTQHAHALRGHLAVLLGAPENRVRVRSTDVGGGFGQKVYAGREESVVALAARILGRPVKWIEDRRENLIASTQSRSERAVVRMAVDDDGTILATDIDFVEEMGAFPNSTPIGGMVGSMFPGPYRTPSLSYRARAVYTNICGRAPYRGPWNMETVAREQMLDHVARELDLDPLEVRRRNVLHDDDLPYQNAGGMTYEDISVDRSLDQAAAIVDYAAFREEQRAARAEGRCIGIGIAMIVEPNGFGGAGAMGSEQATIRIEPSGVVNVLMGTASTGNSVETTIPQVVAEHLGCSLESIVLQHGDTAVSPFGNGTGGSRYAPMFGNAARKGAILMRDKVATIAAHAMEAAPEDIEVAGGFASVRGTPSRRVSIEEVAHMAYLSPERLPTGLEPGLEIVTRFRPDTAVVWSNACHICTCEVDVHTGVVTLRRYIVSEDCGTMINPMVVEGQVSGGVVQGIGGVLFEDLAYDDHGNPLATTFLDYLLPTASDVPAIEFGHLETPAANPGGYKGMGEGGAMVAPAAVFNAIGDALAQFGVAATLHPLGPSQVLELIGSSQLALR